MHKEIETQQAPETRSPDSLIWPCTPNHRRLPGLLTETLRINTLQRKLHEDIHVFPPSRGVLRMCTDNACDRSLKSSKCYGNTRFSCSQASAKFHSSFFFLFLTPQENEAGPFLTEAANTLNIRKSFHHRAGSKLNRAELFGRGFHFLLPTPSLMPSIQQALISLYKWKLNHCIPGWKMIGNESMSEVKT